MKLTTTVVTTTEVNLYELAYKDWPIEAKEIAIGILMNHRKAKEFKEQLFKKDWLIEQVNLIQAINEELERELKIYTL